jgi:poly(U)-specific endoribonuclease
MKFASSVAVLFLVQYACGVPVKRYISRATNAEIQEISSQIWAADSNRITGSDVQYNVYNSQLFTYVNEARLTGTYALMMNLFDNYIPETGTAETCGVACVNEQDAFLDGILATEPMQLLHSWLVDQGLASSSTAEFKSELRQYWFYGYTRSGGPLDSSGFEHVFVGEIKSSAVSGSHNWVNFYLEEKEGNFEYGTYQSTCSPEIIKFGFDWLGYPKSISSTFVRTSPEVEVALYTLCLLARVGSSCPVILDGNSMYITTWDMTGLPTTIGSAYPNC